MTDRLPGHSSQAPAHRAGGGGGIREVRQFGQRLGICKILLALERHKRSYPQLKKWFGQSCFRAAEVLSIKVLRKSFMGFAM